MERKLIDLFGISLKGLTAQEAMGRSGVRNSKHCWDNVLESMSLISDNPTCELIVTYVCYDDFELNDLIAFSDILEKYDGVYLKINNYQPNQDYPTPGLKPKSPSLLHNILKEFLVAYPMWKNRITLVDGPKAVSELKEVKLM